MNRHSNLLSELLRPQNLSDMVLPEKVRKFMERSLESGTVMNVTFYGRPGIGKTSAARLLAEHFDDKEYNGSHNHGEKTTINEILRFASCASITGQPKLCIIDEADSMPVAMQNALRSEIENLSKNCRFVLIANNLKGVTDALKSRCAPLSFNLVSTELKEFKERSCGFYARRLSEIGLSFDRDKLCEIVHLYLPDYRSVANAIEREFGTPPDERPLS